MEESKSSTVKQTQSGDDSGYSCTSTQSKYSQSASSGHSCFEERRSSTEMKNTEDGKMSNFNIESTEQSNQTILRTVSNLETKADQEENNKSSKSEQTILHTFKPQLDQLYSTDVSDLKPSSSVTKIEYDESKNTNTQKVVDWKNKDYLQLNNLCQSYSDFKNVDDVLTLNTNDKFTISETILKELKDQEGQLKDIIESDKMHDDSFGVVVSMNNGLIINTSNSIHKSMGYSKYMWQGRSFVDYIHPKDRISFTSYVTSVLTDPYTISSRDGISSVTFLRSKNNDGFYCNMRRYKGLLNTEYSILQSKNLYQVCKLTITFKVLSCASTSPYLANIIKMPQSQLLLIVKAQLIHSVYKYPEEKLENPISFITKHNTLFEWCYVDHLIISHFGYLPQNIIGRSIFDYYDTADLTTIKELHENMTKASCVSYVGKPYQFKCQNGNFALVQTEWSNFVNPWSGRVEFVTGRHKVIQGPINPDITTPANYDILDEKMDEDIKTPNEVFEDINKILNKNMFETGVSHEVNQTSELNTVNNQQISTMCKNVSIYVDCLVPLEIKVPTEMCGSFSDHGSMMLGEISPHHNYEIKSRSETPPSYTQLNYNDNIKRFFNSKLKIYSPEELIEQDFLKENISREVTSPDLDTDNIDNETKPLLQTITPSSSKIVSNDSTNNSKKKIKNNSQQSLTQEMLLRHNKKMEDDLVKQHKNKAKTNKCSEKQNLLEENIVIPDITHGIKRSNSSVNGNKSCKKTKTKHLINNYSTSVSKTQEIEDVPTIPTVARATQIWSPCQITRDSQTKADLPIQKHCCNLPYRNNVMHSGKNNNLKNMCIFMDPHDQKQEIILKELKDQERQLKDIIESDKMHDDSFGVVVSMNNGLIINTSNSIHKSMGYPKYMWQGRSFVDYIHPKDRISFTSYVTSVLTDPYTISSQDGVSSVTFLRSKNNDGFYCNIRKYKGLLNTGYSIFQSKNLYQVCKLTITFKVSSCASTSPYLANIIKMPQSQLLLIVKAQLIHSVYKYPEEKLENPISFITKHNTLFEWCYVDHLIISHFGYLPQNIIGRSIFDYYDTADLTTIKELHENMTKASCVSYVGKPYQFKCQNGNFALVQTEWSNFVNPWSGRVEFVTGRHKVIQGPINPDITTPANYDILDKKMDEDNKTPNEVFEDINKILNKNMFGADILHEGNQTSELNIGDNPLISNKCNDFALCVDCLLPLKINVPDMCGSFSDHGSVMLGEISPHHNYESKSGSETPPSYTQLNYNENIKRFFNSELKIHSPEELIEQDFLKENISREVTSPDLDTDNIDNETKPLLQTITPSSSKIVCNNSTNNSEKKMKNNSQQSLTREMLLRHNKKMEDDLVKQHKNKAKKNKCSEKQNLLEENIVIPDITHGIKRSNSSVNGNKSCKKTKTKHLINNYSTSESKTQEIENVPTIPTIAKATQIWAPCQITRDSQTTADLPIQKHCYNIPLSNNVMPAIKHKNYKNMCIFMDPHKKKQESLSSQLQPLTMPYYASAISDNLPQPCLYYHNQLLLQPYKNVQCTSNLHLQNKPSASMMSKAFHQVHQEGVITSSDSDCRKEIESFKSSSKWMHEDNSFYSSTLRGNTDNSEVELLLQPYKNVQCTSYLHLQNEPPASMMSKAFHQVHQEEFITSSDSDCRKEIESFKSSSKWMHEDSSFYSSTLREKTDSSEVEEDDSWLTKFNKSKFSQQFIKKKPFWMEDVVTSADLVFRYQIEHGDINEILKKDMDALNKFTQPELVNEQFRQLCEEIEINGSSKSCSNDGTSTSSREDECLIYIGMNKKRKVNYSKLAMYYEENASIPPPTTTPYEI